MAGESSQGSGLFYEDPNTPDTWIKVAGVVSIDGPTGSSSELDASDLDSTAREYVPALPDEGSVSLEMNLLHGNATQEFMQDAKIARTTHNWRIRQKVDPDKGITFAGYVSEFSFAAGTDAIKKISATLRVTEAVSRYDLTPDP
ncbi:phage tail tube protein [Oceanibaculum indicum]|uniref:Major tail protein n=1 Tax=Oceanibaculum indicum P24 TaxID=1207063 RepID=K2JU66_9PROT|nr:phage tail tube protein [Oceanibaculum indicum]EKE68690.1 hypothetical protein P24_17152 [Oceanibaculum indicum P24]